MRRTKSMGTVVKIRDKFYARRRRVGTPDEYGPARDSQQEADRDRRRLFSNQKRVIKRREIPTLRDWSLQCLEGDYGASLAPSTHSTNSTIHVSVLSNPELATVANMRLDRIEADNINWLVSRLTVKKSKRVDGELETVVQPASTAWQHRVSAYLQKLFTLASAKGLTHQNPYKELDENGRKRVKLKKIIERDNRVLKIVEAEHFVQPDSRLECMLFIQLMAGLRTSELLNLAWADVDFAEGVIQVPGTKTEDSKKIVIATAAMLEVIGRQPRRSRLVFTTESGKAISRHNYARDFAVWKSKRGLPATLRPQDLRGSHGNFILKAVGAGRKLHHGAGRKVHHALRHCTPSLPGRLREQSGKKGASAASPRPVWVSPRFWICLWLRPCCA